MIRCRKLVNVTGVSAIAQYPIRQEEASSPAFDFCANTDELCSQYDAFVQVKESSSSGSEAEATLLLVSQPQTPLWRLPGCKLYYSEAIRGVPHPLVKLV